VWEYGGPLLRYALLRKHDASYRGGACGRATMLQRWNRMLPKQVHCTPHCTPHCYPILCNHVVTHAIFTVNGVCVWYAVHCFLYYTPSISIRIFRAPRSISVARVPGDTSFMHRANLTDNGLGGGGGGGGGAGVLGEGGGRLLCVPCPYC